VNKLRLYVKSEKANRLEFTMPHHSGGGHWCSAGYRSKGTEKVFKEEDAEAIEYLDAKGVSYSLIDLSETPVKDRIWTRISGMNRTPILILDNGTRLKNLGDIKQNF